FGVFADDGYKLTTGANPRDAFAFKLGQVDSGRGVTSFSFAVTQAGYYPFRLLYYEGQGAAGLEWFAVDRLGQRVLINDRLVTGHIKAYGEVSATRAFVRSVTPKPGETGVPGSAKIEIVLEDGTRQVQPNSVELYFNGQKVPAAVTKPAPGTTTSVVYDPPGRLR